MEAVDICETLVTTCTVSQNMWQQYKISPARKPQNSMLLAFSLLFLSHTMRFFSSMSIGCHGLGPVVCSDSERIPKQ
jgi:hypothetical protein